MKKLIYLFLIAFVFTACTPKEAPKYTLEYWGVYEPNENMTELINEYQTANPNITINYTRRGLKDYSAQLVARAGKENGPDMFRFHNSWTPALKPVLAVTPQSIVTQLDYTKTFYPVVQSDLKATSGYYGIPLMYDGLGLYYNKDIFKQGGLSKPPETWSDIVDTAIQLKTDTNEKLDVGGIAMGSTQNVDYWSDIFALLMLQQNASLSMPDSTVQETETALKFYTDFINEHEVWSESMVGSTDAFAQGKVAMIFGTSWTAFEIQAKNPQLQFAVAPIPQVPGPRVGLASYFAEGVASSIDKNKQLEAWKFIAFLASKENQQRLYSIQGKTRLFGEPYSRTDLASEIQDNEILGGILATAPVAKSTYMSDKTFNEELNQQLINIYKRLFLQGREGLDPEEATPELQKIYTKYKISRKSP